MSVRVNGGGLSDNSRALESGSRLSKIKGAVSFLFRKITGVKTTPAAENAVSLGSRSAMASDGDLADQIQSILLQSEEDAAAYDAIVQKIRKNEGINMMGIDLPADRSQDIYFDPKTQIEQNYSDIEDVLNSLDFSLDFHIDEKEAEMDLERLLNESSQQQQNSPSAKTESVFVPKQATSEDAAIQQLLDSFS
jgi:hypothetical protein